MRKLLLPTPKDEHGPWMALPLITGDIVMELELTHEELGMLRNDVWHALNTLKNKIDLSPHGKTRLVIREKLLAKIDGVVNNSK